MLLQSFTIDNTDRAKLIDVKEGSNYKVAHSVYARNSAAEPAIVTVTQTFEGHEAEIFSVSLEGNQTDFEQVYNLKIEIEPNSFVSAITTQAGVSLELVVSDHVL